MKEKLILCDLDYAEIVLKSCWAMSFSSILICKQTLENVNDYCCFYPNMTRKKSKTFCTKWPKKLEIGPFPSFEKVALQVKLLQAKQIGFLHNCAIAF